MKSDVIIIGGGLAGLALAERLHLSGQTFHLFEARDRFGGRIDAVSTAEGRVDLGPSWFWPGQPRMADLTHRMNQTVFPQYANGEICLEDQSGEVHRGAGFASMEGSYRVEGGMMSLVDALVAALPRDRLHLSSPIHEVHRDGTVKAADGAVWQAEKIVIAMPPRVAAGLNFVPPLSTEQLNDLHQIPTWMAGHAKFVALYDTPFWRDDGLSGDAMSRRGPLMEIHDASGANGTPAAIFGFIGIPAELRTGRQAEIEAAALDQLSRIFGPRARHPRQCVIRDWALETPTATRLDFSPPLSHPAYSMPVSIELLWQDGLYFAATEMAPEMGGYMEGALAAAEAVAAKLGA